MKKNLKSVDLHLICNLALSVIVLIMGIVIMIFKAFGLTDIILYVSVLFYTYAFFSVIAYFVKRKEGDYELLLLSLINIIVATYMFVFQEDSLPMILGSGMTIYTILVVANRGYKILQLKNQDSYMWIIKFIMTFLIAFVGILTTINLFNETTVQTMMMGYYFITNGVLMTIESLVELFMTDRAFNKIVSIVIDEEDNSLESINETKEELPVLTKVEDKPKTTNKTKKASTKPVIKKEIKTVKKEKTQELSSVKPETKKNPKVESKKVEINKPAKKVNTRSTSKKAPKKEAAIKETKKNEIKVPTKKKAEKPKKEETVKEKTIKTSKKTTNVKTSTKKLVNNKEEVKKEVKRPGRPKKTSSK